jgi:hypothetical protein
MESVQQYGTKQLVFSVCRFCLHGVNQPQIKNIALKKKFLGQALVGHTCNSSYSEDRD